MCSEFKFHSVENVPGLCGGAVMHPPLQTHAAPQGPGLNISAAERLAVMQRFCETAPGTASACQAVTIRCALWSSHAPVARLQSHCKHASPARLAQHTNTLHPRGSLNTQTRFTREARSTARGTLDASLCLESWRTEKLVQGRGREWKSPTSA